MAKICIFSTMRELPYHHDWKLAFQTELGLRVHWFGRYAGFAEWSISPSRLSPEMICFFFVERHSCWTVVNGQKMTLNSGDLLVMRGADEFSFGHNPSRPHVSLSASLALQQGTVANMLLQRTFQRRYSLSDPECYVVEFEKVLSAFADETVFRDLRISGALIQWLAYLLLNLKAPVASPIASERSVVDKVLAAEAWADTRLAKTITLTDWAKSVGLNAVYFGRIFKQETGLTPMEWLRQRRMQMACQYLSGTRKSIAEIAAACGFESQFYFSRVFRRHFGQPPLSYRKARF